jgi:glyoxylase-like metal-dependent hydrolase (beta-lactamase superfamily II)
VGHTDTKATTCLYVPSVSLIVAGDAVYNGTHIFLGESDARERDEWRTALDTIAALAPTAVVAGHKPAAADDSARHIEGTRRYLDSFDRAAAAADDATGLYTAMLREYPDYASPGTLWSSAKTNMSRRS